MPPAIDNAYTNTSIEFAAGVEGALRNLQCHPQRNLTNRQQSMRISRHALQSHNDETSKKLCRRPHDLLRYARCGQARQLYGSEQTQSREFTDFDSRNRCISCSKRRLSAYPGIILGTLLSGLPYESHRVHALRSERFYVRGTAMIRATVLRGLVLTAAFAAALTPATCLGENSNRLPTKATKELPLELLSLLRQKKMPKHSPILVRLFKEEAELEVWKQDTTGRFQILKIYPICRWSGDLGPKFQEGDRQAPEGFYAVTPELMNPNSNFHLAINIGYPNSFDKANNRDGSLLMIHGDCSSSGCYAMTDEQISEIYSLARDSFLGGRPSFQVQAYAFRLTPANMGGIEIIRT